ncbi:hypothetical protein M3Y98_00473200 [Aphelenchoides besseyi]|nr:hypothetical protein M3Y98_00473200 [Aphelenchoides besseyi]KAI6207593.1 hypothetical protein M3Y96_00025300 [Aphelenchoides besseyi]
MNRTRSRSPIRRDHHQPRNRGGPPERNGRFDPDSDSLVYVTNLPYEMSWMELKDLIRSKGLNDVSFAEILKTREGKSKGVAIVELKSRDEANKCIDAIHRHEVGGRNLSAKIIREPIPFFRKIREDTGIDFLARTLERPRGRRVSVERSPSFSQSYDTYGLSTRFLESLNLKPPLVNRVFVTNISYACGVGKFDLQLDADGKSKGMAVVEYSHPIEAVQAISMLNNQKLIDRAITVKMDRFEKDPDRDRNGLPSGLRGVGMGLGANGNPLSDLASIVGAQPPLNGGMIQPFVQQTAIPSILSQPTSFSSFQSVQPQRLSDAFDQSSPYMPSAVPPPSYQQPIRQHSPPPSNGNTYYAQSAGYGIETPYKHGKQDYNNGADSYSIPKQDYATSASRMSGYGSQSNGPSSGRATTTNYTNQQFDHPTRVILIKNLPADYTFGVIANRLQQYGDFESVELIAPGVARVKFLHVHDAEMARQALHNHPVENKMSTFLIVRIKEMGAKTSSEVKIVDQTSGEKPKLKPCCACPETKRVRDECIVLNGEEACAQFIEAHKKCMREHGFNV